MKEHDRPMGRLERRIREAESDLFAAFEVDVEERFLRLEQTDLRVRVLSHGSGAPLLLLHGGTFAAASWAPLFPELRGFRLLAVDLPGHGLSDPVRYRRGRVREHTHRLIDDLLDALGLDQVPVIGHSLGAMFALWHAAAGSVRIAHVVSVGTPAVALPGTRVTMPLSLMTVRGLGALVLRPPSPRPVYRRMLAPGLGSAEVKAAPDALLDAMRLAAGRPENARSTASLIHAIDRFRRPRPESVLTGEELAGIRILTTFVLGSDDPYLSPDDARPSIARIPNATVHELPAGHGPWLVHPQRVAELIAAHQQTAPQDNATHPRARAG